MEISEGEVREVKVRGRWPSVAAVGAGAAGDY